MSELPWLDRFCQIARLAEEFPSPAALLGFSQKSLLFSPEAELVGFWTWKGDLSMSFDDLNEDSTEESRGMWDIWSERMLETFTDAKDALGREAAYHVLLLLVLQQIHRLEPLVEAGWRGDEPEPEKHWEAIRQLCAEIAEAGRIIPASGTSSEEQDEEKGG